MQYKLFRYSEALYPRPYQLNSQYGSPEFGEGKVIASTPVKDSVTHEKFWSTKVLVLAKDTNFKVKTVFKLLPLQEVLMTTPFNLQECLS